MPAYETSYLAISPFSAGSFSGPGMRARIWSTQVPEPAVFPVMQAAIAEQLAILLGEHGGVLAGFDSPKLARQTLRRGQVHHQEEQVVFRLLLDERLKGTAILGGH